MTNHMNAAIEAGAGKLHDLDPRNYDESFETCCAREWELRDAKAVITAALPHLREMIAQEIETYRAKNGPIDSSYLDGRNAGLFTAARIAKGPQQ